jgi:5'-deoxynucleotidase YfbR-like HD superfamily hydrolase
MTTKPVTGQAIVGENTDPLTAIVADLLSLMHTGLKFASVNRTTVKLLDGSPESDTDHTVSLALVACGLAEPLYGAALSAGRIAQLCLVHDLPEVFTDDTETLTLLPENARKVKDTAERAAVVQLSVMYRNAFPWLARTLQEYVLQQTPESRYVWAVDKIVPKLVHILNGSEYMLSSGHTSVKLAARFSHQRNEMYSRLGGEFPEVMAIHQRVCAEVVQMTFLAEKKEGTREE